MTVKERKELHLMLGLCTYYSCCNLIDFTRSKRRCTYHLDSVNAYNKKDYDFRIENNICQKCLASTKPGYIHCDFHIIKENERTFNEKRQRIEEGRCRSCGGPLHKMGKTTVVCVNCNDKCMERIMFN
jgi:hypothetical protein